MALTSAGVAAEFARCAAAVARGLSGGRRSGCCLMSPGGGTFATDLRDVYVAWPAPAVARAHRQALTACLALQASPTKEAVAALPGSAFSPRELAALQLSEGAAAAGWIADAWPGLSGAVAALLDGMAPEPWEDVTPGELAERARHLAGTRRRMPDVPPALGALCLRERTRPGFGPTRRRFAGPLRAVGDAFAKAGMKIAEPIPIGGEEEPDPTGASHGQPLAGDEERTPDRPAGSGGIPYPEWDVVTQTYRANFTRVFASRVAGEAAPRGAATRELEAWFSQPIQRRAVGRQSDGTDLDLDGVTDALIDRLCGRDPGERVYRDRVHTERDVACAVLIDSSGSLARAALLRHEVACADALIRAMAGAGERHAVFSFWSNTRHHVALQVLRGFDDTGPCPSASVLKPAHHTRLGAALRAVTTRLAREPAQRRVLLVLTDGVPFDDGYEGAYACADVAKAAEEADQAQIEVAVLCVGDPADMPLAGWLGDRIHPVARLADLAGVLGDVHHRLAA